MAAPGRGSTNRRETANRDWRTTRGNRVSRSAAQGVGALVPRRYSPPPNGKDLRARSGRSVINGHREGNEVADVLEATRGEPAAFELAAHSLGPGEHSSGAGPFRPGRLSSLRRRGVGPPVPL